MMPTCAAVDIGSNGIRLAIAKVCEGKTLKFLHRQRAAIRLGAQAFDGGEIGRPLTMQAVQACMEFEEKIKEHAVDAVRVVATSAMREARNGDTVARAIETACNFTVEIISGKEEAGLLYAAVSNAMELSQKCFCILDIGGGSLELIIVEQRKVRALETLPLGTIRMLQRWKGNACPSREQFNELCRHVGDRIYPVLRPYLKEGLDLLIGTGGNCECLGRLSQDRLGRKNNRKLQLNDLDALTDPLLSLSVSERIGDWKLRPDRADVIIPAAAVIKAVMAVSAIETMHIPHVGLREGLLLDLLERFT